MREDGNKGQQDACGQCGRLPGFFLVEFDHSA
jgi:hypothetical protein